MIDFLDDVSCSRCGSTTKDLSCDERTGWLWLCDDCLSDVETLTFLDQFPSQGDCFFDALFDDTPVREE